MEFLSADLVDKSKIDLIYKETGTSLVAGVGGSFE